MKISALELPGCFLTEAAVYSDQRGAFFEAFNKRKLEEAAGRSFDFVQDNYSISKKGTLRGLHFQAAPYAQAKLLRVIRGSVLDVIVDLRPDSSTYLQHLKLELSDKRPVALFIPHGIAHGFLALEDDTHFLYKCDNYYHPASERGLHYADKTLGIDWEFPEADLIISEKDRRLPDLKALSL